jgi:hypothetical protein
MKRIHQQSCIIVVRRRRVHAGIIDVRRATEHSSTR